MTILLLTVCLLRPFPASACATAARPLPDVHVKVADETAVILWDARTQTEQFIRHATFETNAADFGFLVPTPTPPSLASAHAEAFDRLERVIQPRLETRTRRVLQPTLLLGSCMSSLTRSGQGGIVPTASSSPGSTVSVLSTWRVGRYDATVLKASDGAALARWLNGHGYATRPAIRDWLAPYVKSGWAITAFKVASDVQTASEKSTAAVPRDAQIGSAVVRMSFQTPQPFFPYREPSDQRTPGVAYPPRLLRVFLLSSRRLDGSLGEGNISWPGRTVWSDTLPEIQRMDLTSELALPPEALPPGLRLTVAEDHSSPRPGTDDLYFRPAADQAVLLPPPVIDERDIPVPVPLDLLLVIGVLLVRVLLRTHQARKRGWA